MATKTRPCEICGKMIEPERLEVQIETQLCAKHAREIQEHGGEFILTARENSIPKQGCVTRNWEDVVARRRRNFDGIAKLRAEYERGAN